tara:strand:+ start:2293 stop:2952 length:660 start_codon:yes stop_codon:yes gene_type:complete
MKNGKKIYEMSPEELNDTYQEVILKHLEAEEASRIMRSVGELKSQRENWIDFEKTYPPKADESKKIAFLNLMKAPSKVHDESKNNDESKYEQAKNAFSAAYPEYKRGYLPNTPAKRAYERYKMNYQNYSDLSDSKLIKECERVILNSPDGAEYCFHVAYLTENPWPEAEQKIAESAWWSYMYAKMILKGQFLIGEKIIMSDEFYKNRYMKIEGVSDINA